METFRETYKNIFEPELLQEIENIAQQKEIKAGNYITKVGNHVRFIPLILEGTVKVSRVNDNKEAFLYHIGKGETCTMTFTCCMQRKESEVNAYCEEDTILLMIPLEKMDEWMHLYSTWKSFVMNSFQQKFDELLNCIDQIAFMQLDERILRYLKELSTTSNSNLISISHSQIAKDLSTSRVVVSRIIKKMESKGLIESGRNTITLV